MCTVHHLKAENLVVGASPVPRRRPRKPSLASTLKAARKAGADHVVVDGKIVIALVGKTATGNDPAPDAGVNEWDDVLPGGDDGAH